MNLKNLMMWGIIVLLVVGLFQLFQNPKNNLNSEKIAFSNFIKNVEDGHLNNDLVDLGIVSSYETAQQELLDPKINAQAADAIARRRDRYTGHTEGAFDWSAFPSSLFYGRRNQDFDLSVSYTHLTLPTNREV